MWWTDFREKHVPELNGKNILWNNELIRIADRPIYYPKYVNAGVIYCQDLFFIMNMPDSLQQVMKKGLKNINFLQWRGLRSAVPSELKELTHSTNTESFIFCIDGKKYNLKYCKSKSIYSALIQSKAEASRGFKKLVSDFSIDSETVQKAFLVANRNASESFLKSFQYKILNDITFTTSRLAKIGYIPCDLFTFCNVSPETRDHLFYLCKYAKEFWEQFEEFWMSITKQNVSLSLKDIIVGVIETNASLLNYLIVLGKYFIWNSRKQNNFPNFYLFTSLIKTNLKQNITLPPKTMLIKGLTSYGAF